MTGYKSKKAAAQDKLAQKSCACAECGKKDEDGWALYCVACIDKIEATLAQPAQKPVCPECKAEVLYECVACSSNNYPAQEKNK